MFYGHRQLLVSVAGWFIIALGGMQILGRSFAGRFQRVSSRVSPASGWLTTLVLGSVYGLAGFCSGPILGAILTMAVTRETPVEGGALLAVYALGMAAPLFVLAALWDRFDLGHRRLLRGTLLKFGPVSVHSTSLISGVLFVAIGVLFLRYDGTAGITGVLGFGDTTDLGSSAQQRIGGWLNAVPAWSFPAFVALVAGVVALLRAWQSPSNDTRCPESAERHETRC